MSEPREGYSCRAFPAFADRPSHKLGVEASCFLPSQRPLPDLSKTLEEQGGAGENCGIYCILRQRMPDRQDARVKDLGDTQDACATQRQMQNRAKINLLL